MRNILIIGTVILLTACSSDNSAEPTAPSEIQMLQQRLATDVAKEAIYIKSGVPKDKLESAKSLFYIARKAVNAAATVDTSANIQFASQALTNLESELGQ